MRYLSVLLAFAALPAAAQTDVSWETLGQVKLVRDDARFVPDFEERVRALDGQQVTVEGFMLPLEQATEQAHFILSAFPVANCFYCMPGGPEAMIEVRLGEPIAFSYEALTVSGTLELLEDDPMGMYYRLVDARPE
jgi:hypothetical protein